MNNYLATKCSFGTEALKVKGAINGFTDTLCPFLTHFLVLSMALYSPEYNEDPKCIQCRKHPEKHKEVKIQCLLMGLVEASSSPQHKVQSEKKNWSPQTVILELELCRFS